MRTQVILIATLLVLGAGLSMNAHAKHPHYGKKGHTTVVHHYHYPQRPGYRPHRGHRHRGHSRRYHTYRPVYHEVRYYSPQRRTYIYAPPPPGVSFEYYRPSTGIWVRVGF